MSLLEKVRENKKRRKLLKEAEYERTVLLREPKRNYTKQKRKWLHTSTYFSDKEKNLHIIYSVCENKNCISKQKKNVFDFIIDDPVTTDRICTMCGYVQREYPSAYKLGDYTSPERFYKRSSYNRSTHLRERLRELVLQEPVIASSIRDQILATYRKRGRGCKNGEWRRGPEMSKGDVKDLLREANVSTKKYLEKWLTIRKICTGYQPPRLHPSILDQVQNDFSKVKRIWQENRNNLRRGRKNLIKYNEVICNLLLRAGGQAVYDTYRDALPGISNALRVELLEIWRDINKQADWIVCVPVSVRSKF
jgi:hypothetical protein